MTSTGQLPEFDKQFIASFWNTKIVDDRLSKGAQYSSSCRDIRQCSQDSSLSSFEDSMTSSRDTIPSTKTFHLRNIAPDSQPRPLSDTRYDKSSKVDYETMKLLSLDRHNPNMQSKSVTVSIEKVGKDEKDIRRTQSDAELGKGSKRNHSFKSFSFKRAISPLIFRQKKNQKVEKVETSLLNVKTKIKKSESVSSIPVIMETGFPATSTNNIHRMTSPTGHDSPCIRGLVSPLVHPRNTMNFPTPLRPRNSLIDTPEKPKIINTRIMRQKYQPLSPKKTSRVNSEPVKNINQPICIRHQPIIKSRSPLAAKPVFQPIIKTDALDPVFSDPKPISECPPKHIKPIPPSIAPKPKVTNSNTLLKKCIECNTNLRRKSGEHLAETLKPLHKEMLDILKEYGSNKNIDTPVLQQKLKEIKKELEDYKSSVVSNEKVNNIREEMKQGRAFGSNFSSKSQYSDEVFLRTDKEMLSLSPSKDKESNDDYYKEIEVRINPEGIAVVRRHHRALFDNDRSYPLTRRSTIHVDDRVFCDKAVLHSIYGHDPSHVKESSTAQTDHQMKENEIKLRPFMHQKSVPNLAHYPSSTYRTKEEITQMGDCPQTERLKIEFNKSKANNLPIHKKYIKAYSKFYERKLALKLLDLNKFIKEEKENKLLLDEKIKKSFVENDKLIQSLNLLKKDILSIIEDIETPV